MKKEFKFISMLLLMIVMMVVVTGCASKREEVKFKGEEGTIVFSLKEEEGYKISTNEDDFRTTREQAVLIGKDFKIGIEFDDTFEYFYNGDFSKLKDDRKSNADYKEVTYSNIKGIQYFYPGYMRYNVILPVKNNKKYVLILTVYGKKDNEKSAKEAIKSEEVQDVLNNITEVTVKE